MRDESDDQSSMQKYMAQSPRVLKQKGKKYPCREELHDRQGLRWHKCPRLQQGCIRIMNNTGDHFVINIDGKRHLIPRTEQNSDRLSNRNRLTQIRRGSFQGQGLKQTGRYLFYGIVFSYIANFVIAAKARSYHRWIIGWSVPILMLLEALMH